MTATLDRRLQLKPTDTAFRTLVAATEGRVRALVDRLVAGDLDTAAWQDRMLETLAEAHAQAGYRGRLRAGDTAPYDRDDTRFGALVADEEARFLWRFRRDIEGGRYGADEPETEAIARRALFYVSRLYGTANEALALTADEPIWWRLGEPESSHCRSCPRLAENSPYPPGQLPTVPRGNQTTCKQNCLCWLETASGLIGFTP